MKKNQFVFRFWMVCAVLGGVLASPPVFAREHGQDTSAHKASRRLRPRKPVTTPIAIVAKKKGPKHALASSEMLREWLGGSDTLSISAMQNLMTLASEDSESKELLERAMTLLKVSTAEELAGKLEILTPEKARLDGRRVVAGEFSAGDESGEFIDIDPRVYFANHGVNIAQIEPYRTIIENKVAAAGAFFHWTEVRSSLIYLHTYSEPRISLPARSSVADAYETFMHELTHFVRFSPQSEPDPMAFDTEQAYEYAFLSMPGEELDARVSGIRALTRLLGEVPYHISLPLQPESWFSLSGDLIQPADSLTDFLYSYVGYRRTGVMENRIAVKRYVHRMEKYKLQLALWVRPTQQEFAQYGNWRDQANARIAQLDALIAQIDAKTIR